MSITDQFSTSANIDEKIEPIKDVRTSSSKKDMNYSNFDTSTSLNNCSESDSVKSECHNSDIDDKFLQRIFSNDQNTIFQPNNFKTQENNQYIQNIATNYNHNLKFYNPIANNLALINSPTFQTIPMITPVVHLFDATNNNLVQSKTPSIKPVIISTQHQRTTGYLKFFDYNKGYGFVK